MSNDQVWIIDCDPGVDGAVALLTVLSSKSNLNVIAITTVNGNKDANQCTQNTMRVLAAINSKIPLYKGCEEPII